MSKRYRILIGTAAVIAVLAVGGIAAAEQGGNAGGNSADHRQNPTTSTGVSVDDTTTTTSASLPPQAKPHGQGEVEGQDEAATPDGLCDVALWNASDEGVLHGEAFKRCDGYATRIAALGTANEHGQGGPPENPGSQGQDNGQGQGAGPDNTHAQGHGKP